MEPYTLGGYSEIWHADGRRLGLASENFDRFFADVRDAILAAPYAIGEPVRNGDGAVMLSTKAGFPDLPALKVYYKPDIRTRRVVFIGMDRDDDPSDWPDKLWF